LTVVEAVEVGIVAVIHQLDNIVAVVVSLVLFVDRVAVDIACVVEVVDTVAIVALMAALGDTEAVAAWLSFFLNTVQLLSIEDKTLQL
jgi:hypothetical protein